MLRSKLNWLAAVGGGWMLVSSCKPLDGELDLGCSEPISNDSADRATSVVPGAPVPACIGDALDLDFYEVIVPEGSSAGGYAVASLLDVGGGALDVDVYADGVKLFNAYEAKGGASMSLYWAAAPDVTYHIAVSSFAGSGFEYTLVVDYREIDDPHEPDDSEEDARLLVLGKPTEAFFFAGYSADADREQRFEDWVAFSAQPGVATISLDDVPDDVAPDLILYDPSGAPVGASKYSDTPGVALSFTKTLPVAGIYRLKLAMFAGSRGYGKSARPGEVPDSFTHPYTLTVTQP